MGFSGLTADAQVLTLESVKFSISFYNIVLATSNSDIHGINFYYRKFLRTECLNSKYAYDTPHSVARLVAALGASMTNKIETVKIHYVRFIPYRTHSIIMFRNANLHASVREETVWRWILSCWIRCNFPFYFSKK